MTSKDVGNDRCARVGGRVTVLLVEDHAATARAYRDLLESEGELAVSVAHTVADARRLTRRARFDAALVDVGLPDGSGHQVVVELAAGSPPTPCLMITVFDDPESLRQAICAGARGYVLKDEEPGFVLSVVRQLLSGGTPVSDQVATRLFELVRGPPPAPVALTPRETELLQLLARGLTYDECARALGIALGTVQHHVKRLYGKLDVCSKAEATAIAIRLGLAPA